MQHKEQIANKIQVKIIHSGGLYCRTKPTGIYLPPAILEAGVVDVSEGYAYAGNIAKVSVAWNALEIDLTNVTVADSGDVVLICFFELGTRGKVDTKRPKQLYLEMSKKFLLNWQHYLMNMKYPRIQLLLVGELPESKQN